MLNEAYEMVRIFQIVADQPVSNVPQRLEKKSEYSCKVDE